MNNAVTKTELENFAAAIKSAAKHPATKTYYGELAFIGSIKAEFFPRTDRATFEAMLLAAHQEGLLRLQRADLVGAMDSKLVESSEVTLRSQWGKADFHFVAV